MLLFSITKSIVARVRLVALGAFFFVSACAETPQAQAPIAQNVDNREIVALVDDTAGRDAIQAAAQSEGYTLRKITNLPSLGLIMLSYDMAPGVTGKEAIQVLEGAVPGSTVGVNHAFKLQQSASTAGGLNYANALLEWPQGGCRALGPVGVIDSGVDASSPGLAAARVFDRTFFEGRAGSPRHGTEVATILADPNRLTNVTIYSANVFEQSPDAGLAAGADSLVRALDWMAERNVRVVNLALAGPYNKLLDLAVIRAAARGLIMVAAVGNDGPNVPPRFPAGFEDVIAVTAVDAARRIMPNAGAGRHVDVAAPGVEVLVATGGNGRLITGTSIATPFVAARIVADAELMRASSGRTVRQLLRRTATDLGAAGVDTRFGAGLLQAKNLCGSGSS